MLQVRAEYIYLAAGGAALSLTFDQGFGGFCPHLCCNWIISFCLVFSGNLVKEQTAPQVAKIWHILVLCSASHYSKRSPATAMYLA